MKPVVRNNIIVTTLVVLVAAIFTHSPLYDRLYGLSTDLLFFARHHVFGQQYIPEKSEAVVIALDELTYRTEPFSKLPKVLWTPMLANVQDSVIKAGAKVIGYDVIFPTSLESYIPGHEKPFLLSLMKAARQGKVVLGKVQHSKDPVAPHSSQAFVVQNQKNIRSLNMTVDNDGVIRRIPISFDRQDAGSETSMAMELASRAIGKNVIEINDELLFDGVKIASTLNKSAILNFQGGDIIPTYSLVDLYNCAQADDKKYFEKHFKNKVVLIGGVLDVEDRKLTSKRWMTEEGSGAKVESCQVQDKRVVSEFNRDTIPGVFILATAVNNLLKKELIQQFPDQNTRILITLSALFVSLLGLFLKATLTTIVVLAVVVVGFIVSVIAIQANFLIPILPAMTAVLISYLLMLIYRYMVIDKQKNHIRNMFSLYLQPQLVDQMVASEKLPSLGGESREVTAWFVDLANFTRLSEGLEAHELVRLMNLFFAAVTEIVESHGGFIAAYIGDEVYAVFGAPFDDGYSSGHAVAAALKVHEKLKQMNADNVFGEDDVACRIGINTGITIVGNVGAANRFNYSIMGDTVNLASRLEGANKVTKTEILISESVAEQLPNSIILREIATIRVKGKENPTKVYEPIGLMADRSGKRDNKNFSRPKEQLEYSIPDELKKCSDDFSLAQEYFRNREFYKMIELMSQYNTDPVASVLVNRAQIMIDNPPPENWDGVITLTEK